MFVVVLCVLDHDVLCTFGQFAGEEAGRAGKYGETGHHGTLRQNGVVGDRTAVLQYAVPADHTVLSDVHIGADLGGIHDAVLVDEHVIADVHRNEANTGGEKSWLDGIERRYSSQIVQSKHTYPFENFLNGGLITVRELSTQ